MKSLTEAKSMLTYSNPAAYTVNWKSVRVLNEFQSICITERISRFRSFQGEAMITPGTVLLLIPGERHWYQPDADTGWTGFEDDCAETWPERESINCANIIYHPEINSSLPHHFDECIDLEEANPPCMQQLASSLIPRIQAKLYASRHQEGDSPEPDSFSENARHLLEKRYITSLTSRK